jgi:two-component sensor histidine kinase
MKRAGARKGFFPRGRAAGRTGAAAGLPKGACHSAGADQGGREVAGKSRGAHPHGAWQRGRHDGAGGNRGVDGRGGTGFGLGICHTIVTETLGGRIAVDSAPGTGTTVTLRIPHVAPRPQGD